MKETLLMAVDLGTSFIKVGVYDIHSHCIAIADEPVNSEQPESGVFIQHGEEIFSSVVACIQKITGQLQGRAKMVEAIAFTGQMAGFMGIDREWNDITSWSCSLDNRYSRYVAPMMDKYADLILEESGTNSPVMAPKIKWFETEFPDKAQKVAKYIMISGYVLGRLGNVPIDEAVIDASYIEWTGLADVRNRKWSKKILSALEISEEQLPAVVDSNRVCGYLSEAMASCCGLKSGIPLISGAGDKPAGCLGAAIVHPGDTIIEAASYGGFSCCVTEYRPDFQNRRLDVIPSVIPGEFYIHNYLAGSGITLDWFIKTFMDFADKKTGDLFKEIDQKVKAVPPGSDGLMAIGLLGGRALPFDPAIRGLWMGHTWNHRKEHFYRALQESFAYEYALTIDRLVALYPEHKDLHINIIGGGAKSSVLTQLTADVSGRMFKRLGREDVALWGAAIIAGNAIGVFSDIKKTACQNVSVLEKYHPDPKRYTIYKQCTAFYSNIVKAYSEHFVALQNLTNERK